MGKTWGKSIQTMHVYATQFSCLIVLKESMGESVCARDAENSFVKQKERAYVLLLVVL